MLEPTIPEIIATCPFEPQATKGFEQMDSGETAVIALSVWPQPRMAFAGPGRWWMQGPICAAGAVLANPQAEHIDSRELQGWDIDLRPLLAQIPQEVRDAIACQPRVFAWRVLQMLDAVPEARPLARDLPVLAGLLAFPSRDGQAEPFAEVRAVIHQPRRRLLPLVGLPDAAWIIRVLAKMDPCVLRELLDAGLIQLLNSPDRAVQRCLQHLPRLPTDVVVAIADAKLRGMTTFGILAEPAKAHGDLADKLIRLHRAGRTRRFKSRAEVEVAHQALPADLQRLEDEHWNPADFAGDFKTPTDEIVVHERAPRIVLTPIRNAEEMRAHGLVQESCVTADDRYPRWASRGLGAMYTALWRRDGLVATVWLRTASDGQWIIAELAEPENVRVPPGIEDLLETWVASLE